MVCKGTNGPAFVQLANRIGEMITSIGKYWPSEPSGNPARGRDFLVRDLHIALGSPEVTLVKRLLPRLQKLLQYAVAGNAKHTNTSFTKFCCDAVNQRSGSVAYSVLKI